MSIIHNDEEDENIMRDNWVNSQINNQSEIIIHKGKHIKIASRSYRGGKSSINDDNDSP